MKTYTVDIKVVLEFKDQVQAKSKDEAIEKAKEMVYIQAKARAHQIKLVDAEIFCTAG